MALAHGPGADRRAGTQVRECPRGDHGRLETPVTDSNKRLRRCRFNHSHDRQHTHRHTGRDDPLTPELGNSHEVTPTLYATWCRTDPPDGVAGGAVRVAGPFR